MTDNKTIDDEKYFVKIPLEKIKSFSNNLWDLRKTIDCYPKDEAKALLENIINNEEFDGLDIEAHINTLSKEEAKWLMERIIRSEACIKISIQTPATLRGHFVYNESALPNETTTETTQREERIKAMNDILNNLERYNAHEIIMPSPFPKEGAFGTITFVEPAPPNETEAQKVRRERRIEIANRHLVDGKFHVHGKCGKCSSLVSARTDNYCRICGSKLRN
jgi:hypothetical protein